MFYIHNGNIYLANFDAAKGVYPQVKVSRHPETGDVRAIPTGTGIKKRPIGCEKVTWQELLAQGIAIKDTDKE